ncbi:MAG: YadA-like family protein [Pseudomonadota bacterium]
MKASVENVRVSMNVLSQVTEAQFGALSGRVTSLEAGLVQTNFRLEELDESLSGGIAASMALGNAPIIPGKNVSVWVNAATYGGQQGFAGNISGRVSEAVYVSAGVSGNTGDDQWGARVGVGFGF